MPIKNIKYFNFSLPITRDVNTTFFKCNTNAIDAVEDDLRTILLTNKNERVMQSNFGCGLNELLFEQDTSKIKTLLFQRIDEQLRDYKDITILSIQILTIDEIDPIDRSQYTENTLLIKIKWKLKTIQMETKELTIKLELT